MTTFEFLSYLRTLNVKVWAEGAKLRYRAPERALSPSLQAELAQRKPEILRVLNEMEMSAQPARLPLRPAPPGSDLPLSFSQQRLWFLDQMEPGNALYNESEAVRLLGPLDVPALERTLGEIVRRHEVLRANFPAVDGYPRQIIAPAYFLDLPITDLSELPEGQREDEIRRLIKAEAQRPFDLWKDRLIRVRLLRSGADEHLLIITMHHIVTDRWSIGVLVHEVGLLYQSFVSGNSSPLPELPIQYADYAYWQRQWLSGEALESQLGYWKRQLAGPLPVLEVPTDRRRAPFRTFRGARRSVILAPALCRELENLSRERGVTLFMVLLAAFQTLLHRYTGQTDIIVGSPVANRTPVDVEVLIGCFVNTLVLRTDLSGAPSFLELLTRVRDVAVGAYAHQDLPFEKLVEELQPERDLSRTPLFQVMAVLQNAPLSIPKLNGLELQPIEIDPQTAKFDLTLYLTETAKGLRADVEYNTDLFNEDTITRALGHYRRLLEEVVVNPERRLVDIPLLTAGERAQLLAAWNETGRDYPQDCCLSQLVETQVERAPDAVAVVFEQECITYRELNRRSNQLAHRLCKSGVKPDARVALCVARGLGMVVGALAIVKAGGAYVPLDPEYPIERLTYMLADSAPMAALTHAQVGAEARSALVAAGAPVIDLEADSGSWESESDDNPNRASMGLTSEHLAHVLYTSGSTGKPKGVMVRRQGVVNLLRSMLDFTNITSADCALALTTLVFDIAGLELFLPLICGARIALVGAAEGHDPEALARTITRCGVTMLQATPATWRMLLESGWRGAPWLKALCTGEALPVELAGRIGKRVGRLWNGYGPTETTIFSSTALVDATTGAKTTVYESIGRPVANTKIYLLDRRCEPAPIGVAGEIYIGGVGVARGYMNQPEQTAERFVADPFADEANARMYKTGDVGRYLPDGRIEYLGRNDFQVKVRGFRIELGEIEARLAEHPGVREAVVVAREEGPGDRRLVAYYTESTAVAVNAETLRAHVSAALPEYMAPAAYVALPAMPVTSNGKLDRKALPTPEREAYASQGYEAPAGEIETALAKIWAEALRLERVGRHDNFFTMGGHSLLAVGLIERMRQEGLQADLRALFTAPTLSALASAVSGDVGIVEVPPNRIPPGCDTITPEMLPLARLSSTDIERIVSAAPGGATNIQDIYPLAPLQEGILFHHLMASEGDMYLAPSLYSVGSRAQLDAYLRALQAVIDRHDMLRTSIHWEGLPQPVQVVWRQATVAVEEARFDAAGGDIAEQLKARFDPRRYRLDVRRAPLMRVCVAEDAPNRRWVVLWLSHHLLGDPIALAVMREEIQAHLLGQVERLPEPLPFRNFVAQALLGAPREEHEAFFRQMLGDVDEPTAPFGLTDARGDGSGIEAAWRQVAGPLVERLRGVGRGLGVSIASLYHLAWALVLARVSGRDDVVFGTVLFGRMQGSKGAGQVVGLLMNTLPVRIRIGDERVEDGVRQTHRLLGELMRHEHAPLALAQRCSGVESPTPLFSALLNYRYSIGSAATLAQAQSQEQGRAGAAWEDIQFEESDELYKRTNYSLTLNVDDLGEGFSLNAQAQSPINPERVCAYMHTALERLVEALDGAAGTPLRGVDVLPASERRRMLVEWNATQSEYPRGKFIQELFEGQAAGAPEAVAVAHQGRQLSYGELNARANRLAHHLRKLGVEPDARVALCAERSLDMVVGLLAILKAGGAYVPLDPAYPIERLRYMLEDSAAMAALTHAQVDREIRSTLAGTGVPVIDLEADAGRWESESDANPDRASVGLSSEHLAYVIYTSGSTGRPKGAMIPHRGICNRLFWMQERYSLTCSDAVLQKTPFSFDVSVWEFFWPLMSGARLVMAKPGGHQDRDYLIEEIERSQITTVHFVPSMLQVFLEGEGLDRLLGLSRVFSSGEALPHELEERFFRLLDAELHNLYGPTEASVDVTYWQCERGGEYQVTPIGRPIANTQIHLLDQHLQPVPLGVAGELHIGGAGLGRGYLARPELTAEKFAPNPFAEEAGARLYKSGDLARYRADENIEFLGRIDHQVKIRGLRIELGEIEEALVRHRSVREAVVVVREDQPGEKRLVAYLTASSGEAVEAGELRAYLKERLPEYMAPAAFAQLERMPLTANGKIDRKALPKPGQDWYGGEYEAPVDEIETTLAQIWAEALQVERVGRHDDFFDLGGHSLLGVKVVSRLRQTFGVEVSTTELFLRPTLAEFAETVKSMAGSASPPITVMARDQSMALSYAQQRLWFLAQMEGVSQAYHIGLGLRVSGPLDREALRRALDRTVARHEALRTTFTQVDGQPVQRIAAEDVGFALQEHDLRHHAGATEELERLMTEEAMASFDLEAGPLARGRLVQLSSSEHALLVTMHHIVSDGWSMGVLTREVIALYRAFSEGQADPLPPLTIQYADYAAWQRRWITGEVLQAQAEYWRNTLAGAPALLELPADRPRPAQQDHAGAEIGLILDEELTADLKALSRRNGATLFMTLLAGWATLLSRLAGQDEVVIGTPVANRTRAEVEPLIGFFVNTLALRLDLSTGPTVSELLHRVKAQALAAQERQDLPFEQVVDILKPPRSLAQSPLFQVMFAWQNNEAVELEAPGLTMSALPVPQVTSKFDLALSLSEAAAGIAGKLEYATALFDGATIERYCGYLRNVLRAMAADDQQVVGRLQILSQSQRQQLLTEWNATEASYPHDQCIHELFEARAARHPDANAVVQEGRHLTYAELNAEANRLARYLRSLGAQPEARVAILLDRSLELVVVELAILKCGAVYVPLDRNSPIRRLTFMIEDCQAGLVLTLKEAELPPIAGATRVDIDELRLWGQSADNLGVALDGEAAAYIMYTSGSSGAPKGVVVPHRAIGRLVFNNGYAEFEADDRVAFAANPAFDATTMEVWAPLLRGGCLVVIEQATLLAPERFKRSLLSQGVNVMWLTVGLFNQYADSLAEVFSGLRYLIVGGDALDARVMARVLNRSRPRHLVNGYGPTETTTFAMTEEIIEVAEGAKSIPIGRPIGNTKVYVLDRHGEPAPVGVTGEIYVGGMGVAHGYLNRPGQTAERFVADPFAGEANARMYKTGDIGRYLADGAIEYLGRNDFQVKIRGFRVELGEVEARLEEQPGIRKAVVVAHENGAGDKYLVAYYTTEPEKSSETTDAMDCALRENLSAVLPEYMAPAAYVKMEVMPLTSNGKLDRRALPAPDGTAYAASGYEAPVGEIETMLAEIWADLLNIERISRHDNFFALGGYSLLGTKLIARIQKELGVEIKVQDLFSKPTLFLLAKHLIDILLAELTAEDLEDFAKQS